MRIAIQVTRQIQNELDVSVSAIVLDDVKLFMRVCNLDQMGFVFRGTIDQMLSPKDGRILQFDGLFENRKLIPSETGSIASSGTAST